MQSTAGQAWMSREHARVAWKRRAVAERRRTGPALLRLSTALPRCATLEFSYAYRTMSTEISTAGVDPLFSSQCLVWRSSGQPTPGP